MKSEEILLSERFLPIASMKHTEFYNDWLFKADKCVRGVGIKIDAGPFDTIYFPLHSPQAYADDYERVYIELLKRIKRPLKRAVDISTLMNGRLTQIISSTALVDRHQGPAFVVTSKLKIIEANGSATTYFAADNAVVRDRNGSLQVRDEKLRRSLLLQLQCLASSLTSETAKVGWNGNVGRWVFSLTRLPDYRMSPLLSIQPPILVRMVKLSTEQKSADLSGFADLFALTRAETRLCECLSQGHDLTKAALSLGITYETVRQRLKSIFSKTNTSRQAELNLLIAKFLN